MSGKTIDDQPAQKVSLAIDPSQAVACCCGLLKHPPSQPNRLKNPLMN
jgi:hypothetical protein